MDPEQPPLSATQLATYFSLMEVAGLLRHAVEQQLRADGDLSYVQFQLLARLALDSESGSERMTDLADGVVHSRSGLTYQAGLLEQAGLLVRAPSEHDERSVTATVTDAGRERIAQVLPGHVEVVRQHLFAPLSATATEELGRLLGTVRDHVRAAPPRSARRGPRRRH